MAGSILLHSSETVFFRTMFLVVLLKYEVFLLKPVVITEQMIFKDLLVVDTIHFKLIPRTPNDENAAHEIKPLPPKFRVEKPSLLSQISPVGSKSVWTIKIKLLFFTEDDLNKMELVVKRQMHMGKGENCLSPFRNP
uniref:MHD domain-containing protein n=1 Tax=Heterorhabditis bacteriophora TaxID=37862 RepID=A0A1I7WYL0_HETBA